MSTAPKRLWFSRLWRDNGIALLLLLLASIGLLGGGTSPLPAPSSSAATNQHATLTNVFPQRSYETLAAQHSAIGSDFSGYYAQHDGLAWLGDALMDEVSIPTGQEQVFQGGVLLRSSDGGTVAALPVVSTLIKAGAQIPIGGSTATLTYGALRPQLSPSMAIPAPWWWHSATHAASQGFFIAEGSRNGMTIGHYIPVPFATYLEVVGDWQSSIGMPVTEAQNELVTRDGQIHHRIVQAFSGAILTYDQDAPASGVTYQPVGADYITIFGPPATSGVRSRSAWIAGSGSAVAADPGTSETVATLGGMFPVALQGEMRWLDGALWYHITWQNPMGQRDGWVMASQLSFTAPVNAGPEFADLAALSPDLAAAAGKLGNNVAVAVGVPALNRYYLANNQLAIPMASTFKLPILLTLISQAEQQHRSLTDSESSLAAPMIENSDNDSAAILYEEIGYDTGVDAFLNGAGVTGISVNTDAFGYSTAPPLALAELLNHLWNGSLVNTADRQYTLDLMSNVESDQRMCVGTTAPTGATVALKDGWIQTDDGGWVNDSMGIVTTNGMTYTLVVLSQDNASNDDGWANITPVCAAAAAAFSS